MDANGCAKFMNMGTDNDPEFINVRTVVSVRVDGSDGLQIEFANGKPFVPAESREEAILRYLCESQDFIRIQDRYYNLGLAETILPSEKDPSALEVYFDGDSSPFVVRGDDAARLKDHLFEIAEPLSAHVVAPDESEEECDDTKTLNEG